MKRAALALAVLTVAHADAADGHSPARLADHRMTRGAPVESAALDLDSLALDAAAEIALDALNMACFGFFGAGVVLLAATLSPLPETTAPPVIGALDRGALIALGEAERRAAEANRWHADAARAAETEVAP